MESNFVLPIIKSTQSIFEMMLQMPLEINEPKMGAADRSGCDVSGIIGMNGDVDGSVVISFPMATALRLVSVFTGMDISEESQDDLSDAIGELANMIAGGAKAQFEGMSVSITCPSVVIGSNHYVHGRKDLTCVSIPCNCDCGEFFVEIAVATDGAKNAPTSSNTAAAS